MTLAMLDVLAVGAVVVAASVAVLVRGRAAATTAFLVFGILLAVLWGRIDAPDVALAEAALGGGIAGALLVDALGRRTPPRPDADPRGRVVTVGAAVVGGAAALVGLLLAVRSVNVEPAELGREAIASTDAAGVSHPVTAVLLNYRSLDTLLEIAVLVVVVVAAGAIGRERLPSVTGADPVRRALAVVLVPVVLVLAIWVLVAGSVQPGGAFQSGALFAAALVIARLCGIRSAVISRSATTAVAGGSLLAFVALAVIGLGVTGSWLGLETAWAGAAILAIEAVLAIGIGVALSGIFFIAGAVDDGAGLAGAVDDDAGLAGGVDDGAGLAGAVDDGAGLAGSSPGGPVEGGRA
ncbi:hydrogenase subunit MbhD domain-containing protein [Microbacterium sp. AG238]|uniref:hydrogenase subunit MbhD domain-containing protein n=1 Tax=Microbacterium sp. AG238 TaxID=2183994 RepID=UPI000E73CD9B|nr:MnhB domain-containing protein [Microbacterium sp. AG238]RKE59311.1 multisubunit sodium/proton antiporter MrpB subunit [Microbacterium sp. AG238]